MQMEASHVSGAGLNNRAQQHKKDTAWKSASKFRSRRRPVNLDTLGSKQLVPDFTTGAVTSDEISQYAERLESKQVAEMHMSRTRHAMIQLYGGGQRIASRPGTCDSKSAASRSSKQKASDYKHLAFTVDKLAPKATIRSQHLTSRPHTAPTIACTDPRPGSPAYFASSRRQKSPSRRSDYSIQHTTKKRDYPAVIPIHAHSQKSSFPEVSADFAPNQNECGAAPPELLQLILGTAGSNAATNADLHTATVNRPSEHVAAPSTLQPGRRFRVATPASVQPVPLPHVAARMAAGAAYDEAVDAMPTLVCGSYSDLIQPESALAAPPANFSPFTVLERLSRPQSPAVSPSTAPLTSIEQLLKKGRTLFEQRANDHVQLSEPAKQGVTLVKNDSFWDELDRFVGNNAASSELSEQIVSAQHTGNQDQSTAAYFHVTNVGSHRSGTAAHSLIKPLPKETPGAVGIKAPRRKISQTHVGVGVELPAGDPMAMRSVQSAQQKLEASFKKRPGQHSAGDFTVVGPRGSSACPTLPFGETERVDGLVFNKLPTDKGPIQAPLQRGQSPPYAQGSFHSPLNTLSLRQRETATQLVLENAKGASSDFTRTVANTFKNLSLAQQPNSTGPAEQAQSTALALFSQSATISPRRQSVGDIGVRTGVGSTRGGTSVASPVSRLQTYGRRNSSAALGTLMQEQREELAGWTSGRTRAETSDGYENAASNGFYAGLRRAGSFIAEEGDEL